MMTTNLFVIANVKQLRTLVVFIILLPFFRTSWGVGVLNSATLTVFTVGLSLARFWRAFRISGGGGWTLQAPPGTSLVQPTCISYFSLRLQRMSKKRRRDSVLSKLQKATARFVKCVCSSAWKKLAPTGRLFVKFCFWVFSKICGENSSFIKIWQG